MKYCHLYEMILGFKPFIVIESEKTESYLISQAEEP